MSVIAAARRRHKKLYAKDKSQSTQRRLYLDHLRPSKNSPASSNLLPLLCMGAFFSRLPWQVHMFGYDNNLSRQTIQSLYLFRNKRRIPGFQSIREDFYVFERFSCLKSSQIICEYSVGSLSKSTLEVGAEGWPGVAQISIRLGSNTRWGSAGSSLGQNRPSPSKNSSTSLRALSSPPNKAKSAHVKCSSWVERALV